MTLVFGTVLICSVMCISFGRKLPSFVTKCKYNDADCVKSRVEEYSKYIVDGVKVFNIPPLNPIIVSEIALQLSWMNSTFKNSKIYNGQDYTVDNLEMDLDKGFLKTRVTHKSVNLKSDFEMNGKLSQLSFHGEGELEVDGSNVVEDLAINGKRVTKNGTDYFQIDSSSYKIVSYKLDRIYFSNIFGGNGELTKRINELIWENRDELFVDVFPIMEKIFGTLIENVLKTTFTRFSVNELFD